MDGSRKLRFDKFSLQMSHKNFQPECSFKRLDNKSFDIIPDKTPLGNPQNRPQNNAITNGFKPNKCYALYWDW